MDDQSGKPPKKRLDLGRPRALGADEKRQIYAFGVQYDAQELPPATDLTAQQLKELAEGKQTSSPTLTPSSPSGFFRR